MARLSTALFLSLFYIAYIPSISFSDDWPAPVIKEVFSKSRQYLVRVIPGGGMGNTYGFEGAPKGKNGTAELYKQQKDRSYKFLKEITLANPVAPVDFYLSNDGYWVTLDNWHNVGHGRVVVFYNPQGKQIQSYELKDLFNETEIKSFMRSTSSIHWREEPIYIRKDQKTFVVKVKKGSYMLFGLETGLYQYCEDRNKKYQCRNENKNRKWVNPNAVQLTR